ncbi:MAG: hypothetical protein Q8P18_21285 [Pseudomonadota bacterium]|nr:hypothetical protein [Pseudomonadota bacterium]
MLLALLVLSAPARALTCDQVMKMVSTGVPQNIVVQAIDEAEGSFSADALACLRDRGAPSKVLAAAQAHAEEEEEEDPAPVAPRRPAAPTPTHDWATLPGRADLLGVDGGWLAATVTTRGDPAAPSKARQVLTLAGFSGAGAPSWRRDILDTVAAEPVSAMLVSTPDATYIAYADTGVGSALVPVSPADGRALWPAAASISAATGPSPGGAMQVTRGKAREVVAAVATDGTIGAVTYFEADRDDICEFVAFRVTGPGQTTPSGPARQWVCAEGALAITATDAGFVIASQDRHNGSFFVQLVVPGGVPATVGSFSARDTRLVSRHLSAAKDRVVVPIEAGAFYAQSITGVGSGHPESRRVFLGNIAAARASVDVASGSGLAWATADRNVIDINSLDRVTDNAMAGVRGDGGSAEVQAAFSPLVPIGGNNGGTWGQDFAIAATGLDTVGHAVFLRQEKRINADLALARLDLPAPDTRPDFDGDGIKADWCPMFAGDDEHRGCPAGWFSQGAPRGRVIGTSPFPAVAMSAYSVPIARSWSLVLGDEEGHIAAGEFADTGLKTFVRNAQLPTGVVALSTFDFKTTAIVESGYAWNIDVGSTEGAASVLYASLPAPGGRAREGGLSPLPLSTVPAPIRGAKALAAGDVLTDQGLLVVDASSGRDSAGIVALADGPIQRVGSGDVVTTREHSGAKSYGACVVSGGGLECEGVSVDLSGVPAACPSGVSAAAWVDTRLLLRCSDGSLTIQGTAGGWWPSAERLPAGSGDFWVCGSGGKALVLTEGGALRVDQNAITKSALAWDDGVPLGCFAGAQGLVLITRGAHGISAVVAP